MLKIFGLFLCDGPERRRSSYMKAKDLACGEIAKSFSFIVFEPLGESGGGQVFILEMRRI